MDVYVTILTRVLLRWSLLRQTATQLVLHQPLQTRWQLGRGQKLSSNNPSSHSQSFQTSHVNHSLSSQSQRPLLQREHNGRGLNTAKPLSLKKWRCLYSRRLTQTELFWELLAQYLISSLIVIHIGNSKINSCSFIKQAALLVSARPVEQRVAKGSRSICWPWSPNGSTSLPGPHLESFTMQKNGGNLLHWQINASPSCSFTQRIKWKQNVILSPFSLQMFH